MCKWVVIYSVENMSKYHALENSRNDPSDSIIEKKKMKYSSFDHNFFFRFFLLNPIFKPVRSIYVIYIYKWILTRRRNGESTQKSSLWILTRNSLRFDWCIDGKTKNIYTFRTYEVVCHNTKSLDTVGNRMQI